MASFQTLRRTAQPSASAGGLRTSWNTLVAEARLAAAGIASALSELASSPGTAAMHSTRVSPEGELRTQPSSAFLTGMLALVEGNRS
jgi:hypothetical protein